MLLALGAMLALPGTMLAHAPRTVPIDEAIQSCTRGGPGSARMLPVDTVFAQKVQPCAPSPGDSARPDVASPDSTADSTAAAYAAGVPRKTRARSPMVFYAAIGVGLAATYHLHLDEDPGGYADTWSTSSSFPDKAVHGLAAWSLTSIGVDMGVKPWTSALAVCAAGVVFEYAQGYVSRYDIGANCVAASGAALWRSWRASRGAPGSR